MSGLYARVTSSMAATPGPGAYQPTFSDKPKAPSYTIKLKHNRDPRPEGAQYYNIPSTVGQGPRYSLGSRHETRAAETTPGPSYVPPPLGSDAKKTSLSFRHSQARDPMADTPGPGAYNISAKFANDAPKASFHGRNDDKFVYGSQSPGPGAYLPNYDATKKRAPSATMHVRTSYEKTDITPGPGAYSISRDLGGKPVSFHSRVSTRQSSSTPGPGAYSPNYSSLGGPKFSMKSRHETTTRPETAQYTMLPSTIGQGPRFSLGSRHQVRDTETTPGPSYIPPPLGSDAKKTSLSFRHSEARNPMADTPGPGAYNISAKFANDAPKASMHGRTKDMFQYGSQSPGPGAYKPDFSATMPRAPSASMHIRPKDRTSDTTPGYRDLGSTLTGPKFTIGRREELGLIAI